ncbi:MAG: hypothetical protein LBL81_00545, partial [Tannerella sp.]|nr:hypothetical protein [Tannerella sp.]
MMRLCLFLFFLLVSALPIGAQTIRSVLAGGHWVRIEVEQTGIYKITYAELKKMGFADPAKVSVHGYGGWPLSEDFSQPGYKDDLPATGVYRGSDYLLFYGLGPVKWTYDSSSRTFVHTNNPYSTYGSYFLTDSTATKDMPSTASADSSAALSIHTYDEYRLYENDRFSPNASGRELFGEAFVSGQTRTLSSSAFQIPGITSDEGKVSMRFIACPRSISGTATLSIDGKALLNLSFPTVPVSDLYTKATAQTGVAAWTGDKSETPQVSISYNGGSS